MAVVVDDSAAALPTGLLTRVQAMVSGSPSGSEAWESRATASPTKAARLPPGLATGGGLIAVMVAVEVVWPLALETVSRATCRRPRRA